MKSILRTIFFYIILHCFTIDGMEIPMIDKNKAALRYGFQNMRDCNNYEKSFLCVTKCLDLHYDVAYADKNCDCTCYHKKDKAKYTILNLAKSTKWRLGTPTTSKPAWAHSNKDQDTELANIEHQEDIQHLSSNEREEDVRNVTVADVQIVSEVTGASDLVDNKTVFEENTTSAAETSNIENQDNKEEEENTENPDTNDNNENEKVTENAEIQENPETF